jgi:hypothetical protein
MKFNFKDFFQNIKSKMTKRHALVAGVIGLALVIAITAICIASCSGGGNYTPTEKTYTVALAVDTTVGQDNKVTNYVAALILDENNKIVAARIDCAETTPSVVDGAIEDDNSVLSKVELGDGYKMDSGSFAQQTKAFEDAIVGKTADEVANLDMTLVTGCTMPYSPASFKAVVAKAFASTNKNTFKTAATFTFGLGVDMSISGGKVTTYYAATAVVGGGVSTNVGATGVLSQTLNYSFQNLDNYMNVPMGERIMLAYNLNRYETSMSAGEPLPSFMKENKSSVWVKPYVIDEDILLKNGAEISNKTYGTLVGYDTGVRKINASLDGAFTAYIGHSGATQEYDGVEAHQKGGLIGGTLSLYKGVFFSATTLSAGALDTESKSMFGKDNYTTLLAGVGNKTGYNFEFNGGKFIIQPSLMLAYSYINTEDYKNVLGVKVKNDAIHSLQISPGVRFIFNLSNGWKPYCEASKVWNVGERGQTSVDGVKLPSMYVKPYEQYGLGIQGHINSHIMLYGQTMIEDGGRDGVLVTGGFRWLF